jgi:DNA-binding LacI/PurR family transcriptional regulator
VIDSNLTRLVQALAEAFQEDHVPVVQMGHVAWARDVHAVVIDSFAGGLLAARHLAARGHRAIATIRWLVDREPVSPEKHAGFRQGLTEAGVELQPQWVIESPAQNTPDQRTGREAIEQLLRANPRPTAVFVENSFVSQSLLYAIGGETAMPAAIRDLDFVHFEAWHLDTLEHTMVHLLGHPARRTKLLRVPWYEMGRRCANLIVELTEGRHDTPQRIELAPYLVQVHGMDEELLPV